MGSLLPVLGLLSGILLDLIIHFSGNPGIVEWGVVGVFNLPGCLFGVAILMCFRKTPLLKAIVFIIVSDIAYYIAFMTAILAGAPFAGNSSWNSSISPFQLAIGSFAGGMAGAVILALGFYFLISRIYSKYGFWPVTLAGGILGIMGFMPGFLLGGNFNNSYAPNFLLLFPIWQVGIAIVLNYYLQKSTKQIQLQGTSIVASK